MIPSVVIGDASRKPGQRGPGGAATLATNIVKVFIDSSQGSSAGMLPELTSLDGVGAGSAACVEGSGVYGGDSRSRGEHRGGPRRGKEGRSL